MMKFDRKDISCERLICETWINSTTGVIVDEQWTDSEGRWHRPGAPSVISRDEETGRTIHEEWNFRGMQHREGAPALRKFDKATGVCVLEEWWKDDKYHRDDGPAVVRRDPKSGEVIDQEFWADGVRRGFSERASARALAERLGIDLEL